MTAIGQPALKAGVAYFAVVFAAGVLLGTLRVLVLAPHLGEGLALAVEMPIMLAVSWIACGRLIARYSVPRELVSRAAMGITAFLLLMIAEIGLSAIGFGRTIVEHLETYRTVTGAAGLLGQFAFALFPVFRLSA